MDKNRKPALYIGGVLGLIIVILLVKFIFTDTVSREIPKISDTTILSTTVKEQISEAYKNARRKPSAENLGMLGMVYHSSANYAEAAKCYDLAIQKNNSEWIWNYYNGYLNMEMGKSDEVIQNFKSVIEKNPEVHHAWYYLGGEYKNLRNYDLAMESFIKIITIKDRTAFPNSTTRQGHFPLGTYANFELSRIYFDTGRPELAEETLKELIMTSSLFGASYKLLGNIYNQKGEPELGKKFTDRSNDLVNLSPPVDTLVDKLVLISRSELYLLKKIDEAEQSFHSDWALKLVNHGLQYMPDNKYLISKAIKINLWKNLNEQAIAFTDKHLSLFEGDFIEIKNTGMFFYQKGLYTQATKYWTKALELKPEENIIQQYLAKCLWVTGDKQKSQAILYELIAKNQENPQVLADVADLLFQFGENAKVAECLSTLKKIDPSNPKAQRISADIANKNGETGKAIALYESSFKGNPQDVQTIINLGNILRSQKMWSRYIGLQRKALEYHPNNTEFLAGLGETLISCPDPSVRNIEEGREFTERAFTYYNCPPDILISSGSHLAYAWSLLGNKQKAITTVSQTINIARRQNIPASQQAKLETMLRAFQQM